MLAFRQTVVERQDPGEALVDKVAGELAFFPDIVAPHAEQCLDRYGLTFEAVHALRAAVAPDASQQATLRALMRYSNHPAWHLRCAVSLKLTETRMPRRGANGPTPRLRVQEVYANDVASECGPRIHRWMRVPPTSFIAAAQRTGIAHTGTERLDDWVTSDGGPIGRGSLFVDAQRAGDEVMALVSLADR